MNSSEFQDEGTQETSEIVDQENQAANDEELTKVSQTCGQAEGESSQYPLIPNNEDYPNVSNDVEDNNEAEDMKNFAEQLRPLVSLDKIGANKVGFS